MVNMKIVQLVYHLGSGGAERFVVNLSNELAKLGHDVSIVQIRSDERGEDIYFNRQFVMPNVKYVNLNLTKGLTIGKILSVMHALLGMKPDVVHSHLNVLPYYYALAIAKKTRIKFVHTIHSVAHKETGNEWQRKFNKWFYGKGFITPVTISDECKKSYEELYKLTAPHKIDNGCPEVTRTEKFESVKYEIEQLKHTSESNVFIHVARLHEAKNQKMLISAFNELVGVGLDGELLIIGNGFDTEEGRLLRSQAVERIHFLGSKSNVGDYLLNSDFFLLSSLWEGLPISLIEAMSAKVIPICTPAGGITNVIKDGETGFISPSFSEVDFVDTVRRATATPISKDSIYKTYKSSFSMEKCAKQYVKVYES